MYEIFSFGDLLYGILIMQTKLLEDYYKQQRKIVELKTSARPGETWQGLVAALHLQHLDAPPTPHKLTV